MGGNTWHLTEKRKAFVIKELTAQMSVPSIAMELGITSDTLYAKLKEAGIVPKEVKRKGLEKLRRSCMSWIYNIDDDKDRADAAMKYLNKYLPADEPEPETTVNINVDAAVSKVLDDLK